MLLSFDLSMTTLSLFSLAQAVSVPQAASSSSAPLTQATTLHRFPNGTFVENFAIRSQGGILATFLSSPEVAYVDPAAPDQEARTIARFPPPATSVLGIAELEPDIFYVATSEFSFKVTQPTANGTGQVWRIDMTKYKEGEDVEVPFQLVANLSDSGFLNGMTSLPNSNVLLIADSTKALIWRLDVQTKEIGIAINDTATAKNASAPFPFGPNGVHAQDGYAYWTNTGFSLFARAPIDGNGCATGPAEILVQGTSTPAPDDFTLTGQGKSAFIADAILNEVQYTSGDGSIAPIVKLESPTSAHLGRLEGDKNALYISSSGNSSAYATDPDSTAGSISRLMLQQ